MGVFGDWANRYFEAGYIVLPIDPGTKACTIGGWNTIFTKDMDEDTLEQYIKSHGHWDIGLVCGSASGVDACDLDWEGEHHSIFESAVLGILPPSPSEKRGKSKWTKFYRHNPDLKLRHFFRVVDGNRVGFFDYISDGPGYTILPPSRHSEGCNYRWSAESLLDLNKDDLPMITERELNAIESLAEISNEHIHATTVAKSKRHNVIFGFVWKHSDVSPDMDTLIEDTYQFDQIKFKDDPKGPYFHDEKYRKRDAPKAFCAKTVERFVEYKIKYKLKKGVNWEVGCDQDYPTKADQFYFREEKIDKNGELVTDAAGNPTYTFKPDYDGMSKYFREVYGLVTTDGVSYIYNGKNHDYISDLELKNRVTRLLDFRYNPTSSKNFTEAVKTKCFSKSSTDNTPGYLNLSNCVLKIKGRETFPHSKKHFFKYCLATGFDPKAECPRWLEFLNFVFEGNQDLVDASQEIFGYCLQGGDPWLHKAFFLYGDGRNGKSTWLETLQFLVGLENCSAVPLSGLVKPFSVVMADGKLINAVSEGESRDLSSEAFKSACSGDFLIAAHKGKPEFAMRWTARLVVSLNNLPNFRDSSAGNIERFYALPFNRYIAEHERDPNIKTKLREELPGILNWALNGLDRLLERGHLPKVEAQTQVIEEYKRNVDSVYQWANEYVHPNENENRYQVGDFYPHYVAWCKGEGRYALAKNSFCRGVIKSIKAKNIPTVQTYSTGKQVILTRCYISAKHESY